jgi:hypothetical protein
MALPERGEEHFLDQVVDVGLTAEQPQPDARDVRREALEERVVGVRQDVRPLRSPCNDL